MDTRTTSTAERPSTRRPSTRRDSTRPPGAPLGDGIRRAAPDDAAAVSRTLANAFRDDPVFGWCMPDAHTRDQYLAPWFRVVVDALLGHEETYCTADASGAALWVPAGVAPMTEEQEAHLGAVTADIGDTVLARIAALTSVMEAHHPHDPHLYLWFVGVHASRQGQGWGGRLLESRLARADVQAVPSYLEATSERNRTLYERHGFEVIGELSAEGSPPMWQMWREPR